MICVSDGAFKLDGYNLVIHPGLTLTAFRRGDIPILEKWDEREHSAIYRFKGFIDGLNAIFWITFASEKLIHLRFWEDVVLFDQKTVDQKLFAATERGHEEYVVELKKWTEIIYQAKLRQKAKHDAWLERLIGAPPPYEYDNWGEIVSLIDPREERVEILVRFKYGFGEDVDLNAYFAARREQGRKLAINSAKSLAPGQLPPGFSRKT